jgi:hypothetical protein
MARSRNQSNTRDDAIRRALHRISGTAWLYVITILLGALLYVSIKLFIRDIETTMWGYQQFPTNKGGADISLYVALFFPVLQMTMGALSIALFTDDDKGNDKWAYVFLGLSFVGFIFDAGTDIFFRTHLNLSFATVAFGLVETILIYTLASEVSLAIAVTGLIIILPYFLRGILEFFRRFRTGAPSSAQINGHAPRPQQQQQRPPQQQGKPNGKQRPPNASPALLRRDPALGEIHRDLSDQGY